MIDINKRYSEFGTLPAHTQSAKNSRVLIGRESHAKGKTFESMIEAACIRYAQDGKAVIDKTPEPMRPIRSIGTGRFIACFEKKAQPDFKGALAGGMAVAFEAKHTDHDRILRSAVTDEQAKTLDALHNAGAVCFVLVSFGFTRYYRIPWAYWRGMKSALGRKYIMPEDVEQYKVHCRGLMLDFLEDNDS